jgi:hypothetical protein
MGTTNRVSTGSSVPDIVDWLVAGLVALVGIGLTGTGGLLFTLADRERLAGEVTGGDITVGVTEYTLSDAEAVSLATDVLTWTGLGLSVAGLVLTVFAVVYGVSRYRSGATGLTTSQHTRYAATCGAVTAVLVPLAPLSMIVGGGVAAALDATGVDRPTRVGALSGVYTAVPAVIILGFTAVGLYTGLSVLDDSGAQLLMLGVVLGSALFVAVLNTAFGVLGGYLHDRFVAGD